MNQFEYILFGAGWLLLLACIVQVMFAAARHDKELERRIGLLEVDRDRQAADIRRNEESATRLGRECRSLADQIHNHGTAIVGQQKYLTEYNDRFLAAKEQFTREFESLKRTVSNTFGEGEKLLNEFKRRLEVQEGRINQRSSELTAMADVVRQVQVEAAQVNQQMLVIESKLEKLTEKEDQELRSIVAGILRRMSEVELNLRRGQMRGGIPHEDELPEGVHSAKQRKFIAQALSYQRQQARKFSEIARDSLAESRMAAKHYGIPESEISDYVSTEFFGGGSCGVRQGGMTGAEKELSEKIAQGAVIAWKGGNPDATSTEAQELARPIPSKTDDYDKYRNYPHHRSGENFVD